MKNSREFHVSLLSLIVRPRNTPNTILSIRTLFLLLYVFSPSIQEDICNAPNHIYGSVNISRIPFLMWNGGGGGIGPTNINPNVISLVIGRLVGNVLMVMSFADIRFSPLLWAPLSSIYPNSKGHYIYAIISLRRLIIIDNTAQRLKCHCRHIYIRSSVRTDMKDINIYYNIVNLIPWVIIDFFLFYL